MVPKKEIHTYIVKAKVTGTNQTTTVLRYSIGGLEEARGTCYLLRCICTDGTETSDRVTLSPASTSLRVRESLLLCNTCTGETKICTGNAVLDTVLPVFCYVFSRSVTVIKFSSLSYKGLKLTGNDQSLTM
jgi:hypothetical protein